MPGIDDLRSLLEGLAERGLGRAVAIVHNATEPPARSVYNTSQKLLFCAAGKHTIALPHKLVLASGEVAWFGPGTWHQVIRGTPRDYLALVACPSALRINARWYQGGPLGVKDRITTELHGTAARHAAELIRAGESLLDTPRGLAELAQAAIRLAMAALADVRESHVPEESAHTTWLQCVTVLEECLGEGLSRDKIARLVGVHPGYLSMLFRRFAGKSFAAYRNELRISRAKSILLAQPELRIGRVGELVGLHDPRYFRRMFQRHTRLCPSEFRNALRK
jgi:AraC-like DNA-binding protein